MRSFQLFLKVSPLSLIFLLFIFIIYFYFIKGERLDYSLSNMAIDDVKLEIGECPEFGSCTFEGNDYCTWSNVFDARDQFDWEFGSEQTASFSTGPSYN
jgi:hypothetical protein